VNQVGGLDGLSAVKVSQQMLGYRSVAMTLEVYAACSVTIWTP
jgi:hypothetical protein